jgi:3-oxoadipate enol-lactonase
MKANVNGITLGYDDSGTGPALVLLHGFPFDRRMWRKQGSPVSGVGYRVIAPDLPGFGESQSGDGFSLASTADLIVGLLNYLGVGRAVFCGLDLGGRVLFELLERHPQRVAGACFAATAIRPSNKAQGDVLEELETLVRAGQARGFLNVVEKFFWAGPEEEKDSGSREALLAQAAGCDFQILEKGLGALFKGKDYTELASGFKGPVLVLSGESDRVVPPGECLQLGACFPRSSFRTIPGAGHLANLEQAEIFNESLLDFLAVLNQRFSGYCGLGEVA